MPDGGVASNGHGGGRRVNRVHEAEAEPVQGTIRPAGRGRGFAHGGGGGARGRCPVATPGGRSSDRVRRVRFAGAAGSWWGRRAGFARGGELAESGTCRLVRQVVAPDKRNRPPARAPTGDVIDRASG